jgi:nitrous-oxide reductase
MDDPSKYKTLFTCVDAETMEVRWQCRVDGNMDLVATSYNGKPGRRQPVQRRGRRQVRGHDVRREGRLRVLRRGRIEEGHQGRQVHDHRRQQGAGGGRHQGSQQGSEDRPHLLRAGSQEPPRRQCSPDGKYFICSGKLSPTATVIDWPRC